MAVAFSLAGEIMISSPAGKMQISLSNLGLVTVMPSWPRREVARSLDYLRALRSAIKKGKSPKGFTIKSDPPGQTRLWWKKMAEAAEDAVKRFQNDQATFAPPGTPFGKHKNLVLKGG